MLRQSGALSEREMGQIVGRRGGRARVVVDRYVRNSHRSFGCQWCEHHGAGAAISCIDCQTQRQTQTLAGDAATTG